MTQSYLAFVVLLSFTEWCLSNQFQNAEGILLLPTNHCVYKVRLSYFIRYRPHFSVCWGRQQEAWSTRSCAWWSSRCRGACRFQLKSSSAHRALSQESVLRSSPAQAPASGSEFKRCESSSSQPGWGGFCRPSVWLSSGRTSLRMFY